MRPRQYLSWSSLSLFEKDRARWIRKYLYDEEQFTTRAMAFGKDVADALEHGRATGDAATDLAMSKLPRLGVEDKEFSADMPGAAVGDKVPLLCKPDTRRIDFSEIGEFKTGRTKWDAAMVRKSGQLTFYAMGAWVITKKVPKLWLAHMPTDHEDPDDATSPVHATGEVRMFPTVRTLAEVLAMMSRCRKAWHEMAEVTAKELL